MSNTYSILLHACCGPCAIAPITRLQAQGYKVTIFFANPNIHPLSEYLRRREAMEICAQKLDVPVLWRDDLWNVAQWLETIVENTKQGFSRCHYCYDSRLNACAKAAQEGGFDAFTSSLLYSRYQQHSFIISCAKKMSHTHSVRFYYEDFREDWQKGIDMSKEMGLYRQAYCGCIYSEAERYAKKLARLCTACSQN